MGFFFGLSFDSATQGILIGLAAMAGIHGRVPARVVVLLPCAFLRGCSVDTCNGLLTLWTYIWATV